jgi:predicted CXXCH cytochrome family protein
MINRLRWGSIFAAAGLLLSGVSVHAQVVGSQHDLTAAGGAQDSTSNTDEVCVFCHTPHGGDINAPVPLWNKVLGVPGSYTRYSTLATPTFDSAEAPVGSVSLACLSCHDGTQAMDVVLNSPGSGGYNAGGAEIDPAAIGVMTGTPVPNLGTDLSNDHPISMQYGGGGPTDADPDGPFGGTLGDPDFFAPEKDTINAQPIWWVDSPVGTAGTREKTDMLLYTRNDLGAQQPFVECGSCHDPHNSSTQTATMVAFLRVPNTASQVCTSCHVK